MAKKKNEEDEGMSLDDAFDDDEDVEYAVSKPKKVEKKVSKKIEKGIDDDDSDGVEVKGSKSIEGIKKGDKVKVDGKEYEVDAHTVLIDHGNTKEMAIELFDKKTDKDYQLRYFSDNVENSMEFYELVEIIYNRLGIKKVEW